MTDQVQIDITIDEVKHHVELGNALNRLRENRDFQLVIEKGYLQDTAVRVTSALANPNAEHKRNTFLEQLLAISHLQQYLRAVATMAQEGKYTLDEYYGNKKSE